MGADIHMLCEVRKKSGWKRVGRVFPSDYSQDGLSDEPYHDRNYDLFGMLAGVRSEGFKLVAPVRGVPSDVSIKVKKYMARWHGDGHSFSHIYLSELLAYDWKGQKTMHSGVVNALEYVAFKREGTPVSWAAAVGGGIISNSEMEKRLKQHDIAHTYTEVTWEESYYDSAKLFVDVTIPRLQKLGAPDDVRIVFFFDN